MDRCRCVWPDALLAEQHDDVHMVAKKQGRAQKGFCVTRFPISDLDAAQEIGDGDPGRVTYQQMIVLAVQAALSDCSDRSHSCAKTFVLYRFWVQDLDVGLSNWFQGSISIVASSLVFGQ